MRNDHSKVQIITLSRTFVMEFLTRTVIHGEDPDFNKRLMDTLHAKINEQGWEVGHSLDGTPSRIYRAPLYSRKQNGFGNIMLGADELTYAGWIMLLHWVKEIRARGRFYMMCYPSPSHKKYDTNNVALAFERANNEIENLIRQIG